MEKNKKYKLSIIIPAFNEGSNITATCLEIQEALKKFTFSYEIVVIDDGSKDNTYKIVKKFAQKHKNIKLIRHQINLGLGAAYNTGIQNANGTYSIMIPGDNAHPAIGLTPIFEKMGKKDIILPYPSNPEARNKFRQIVSKTFINIFNFWFNLDVPYYNGLVLHKTKLVKKARQRTHSFAYQAEI